jgi:hypothetical protein
MAQPHSDPALTFRNSRVCLFFGNCYIYSLKPSWLSSFPLRISNVSLTTKAQGDCDLFYLTTLFQLQILNTVKSMLGILQRILLGWLNQRGWSGRDMWHTWEREEVFTGFWLGGPKARDHCEDLGVDGRITLRWILGRYGSMRRTGFSWLRIGCSGRLVWTR